MAKVGFFRGRLELLMPSLVILLLAIPASAQVNIDAFRDHFLVGQFGEVCTMCEVTVICQAGDAIPEHESVPEAGSFTLYHIQTRTFWSQVSTIWEWFVANFSAENLAAKGHTRPVHVYKVIEGAWAAPRVIEGRLILDPGVLEFGDHVIDRLDQSWRLAANKRAVGYCARLPLWDALDRIAAKSPGGES